VPYWLVPFVVVEPQHNGSAWFVRTLEVRPPMTAAHLERAGEDDFGGLWDDAKEALRWRPILPLVAKIRAANGNGEKLAAIRDAAAFAYRELMGNDPYKARAFLAFALVVDLYHSDKRVASLIDEVL
jgi:hypothetical protein